MWEGTRLSAAQKGVYTDMGKVMKRIGIVLVCLILVVALVVGGYVLYIVMQYSRIEDGAQLTVENGQAGQMVIGQEYTATTYNIGFGAYNHDFSFFMDSGVMVDGTEVTGTNARAQSAEIVQANMAGATAALDDAALDFCLLQEVDVEADRSFKINEVEMLQKSFSDYASVYASNFHSAFLAYPFHEPHGAVEAGLLTLSRYQIDEATRRSYPVDDSFPTRFFDLDRCFSLLRLPVEGGDGKELVLINTHMSAYDEGGTIRAAQMEMLAGVLAEEYQKGNWVVVGGDFNHALCGTVEAFPSQQLVPEWVSVFDDSLLPEGFGVVCADNVNEIATCRSTDLPYVQGVNYSTVLDGFIVSANVSATAHNMDTGFMYSDHNPVALTFVLEP